MGKITVNSSDKQEKNLFSEIPDFLDVGKSVQISFTAPDPSSNGGLLLAAKAEKEAGIIDALSKCVW